jgi:hypothetical protein
MRLEGTEKTTLMGVSNHHTSFLVTTDSKRQEHFVEYNGMLALHILYIMDRFKSKSSELLKISLPSVPDILQLVEVSSKLLHTALQDQQLYPCRLQAVQALL